MFVRVGLVPDDASLRCRACGLPAFKACRLDPCGCVLCGRCAQQSYMSCIACGQIVVSCYFDAYTENALSNHKFTCECGYTLDYADLKAHVLKCKDAAVSCPNECGNYVKNAFLAKHQESECSKRLVSCEFCGLIVEADQIGPHLSKCGRMKIPCANGCGEMICRGDAKMHNYSCVKAQETCYFCGSKYNSADIEQHFGNVQYLAQHLVGFMNEFRSNNEYILQVYQDFSKRLSKLEAHVNGEKSHNNTNTLSDVVETPRVRTSLRVIPGGQQIGSERVGSSSLVLPLEFRVRNQYEIVTVPPAVHSFIEVKNIITNDMLKISPILNTNYLLFPLSFSETGPFSIILRSEAGQELDKQDINVLAQEFDVSNPNNIGQCSYFCASHQWLYAEPSRFYVVQSEGVQVFKFKIQRANTHIAFGFTENENRHLESFRCCLSQGIYENKELRRADFKFKANDEVGVKIEEERAEFTLNGKQICGFSGVEYYAFYIEIADAELWLI